MSSTLFEYFVGTLRPMFVQSATSPDHGLLMLAVLAMSVDGDIDALERAAIVELASQLPSFEDHGPHDIDEAIEEVIGHLRGLGLDEAIDQATAELGGDDDRELAFQAVAYVHLADGRLAAAESRLLSSLAQHFGFDDQQVGRLLHELQNELDAPDEADKA